MSTEVRPMAPAESSAGLTFEESRRHLERAARTIPGGVHSNIRLSEQPWPLFFDHGDGAHLFDVAPLVHLRFVVADSGGIFGDMLHAENRRVIAGRPKSVQYMLLVIVEDKPAMGQPEHAVAVRAHAGEQAGTARRTGRSGVEGLPEQDAFIGQTLQIRSWNGMSIRLKIASAVVRVDVEDVRPPSCGLSE